MCRRSRRLDTALDAGSTLTAAVAPPTTPLPRPRVTRRHQRTRDIRFVQIT